MRGSAKLFLWLVSITVFVAGLAEYSYISEPSDRLEKVVRDGRPANLEEFKFIRITRKNNMITAKPDMKIMKGDTIETDDVSTAVLRLREDNEIMLDSDTFIRILTVYKIYLSFGKIFVKVKDRMKSPCVVQTTYVAAGAEGTEFFAAVENENEISVIVLEGIVKLTSRSKKKYWELSLTASQKCRVIGTECPDSQFASEEEIRDIIQWYKQIEKVPAKDELRKNVGFLAPFRESAVLEDLRNALNAYVSGTLDKFSPSSDVRIEITIMDKTHFKAKATHKKIPGYVWSIGPDGIPQCYKDVGEFE